jgi:hypothetical protein
MPLREIDWVLNAQDCSVEDMLQQKPGIEFMGNPAKPSQIVTHRSKSPKKMDGSRGQYRRIL